MNSRVEGVAAGRYAPTAGERGSTTAGVTWSRSLVLLAAAAAGYLLALFALTRSNGFWPVPWQHDDYYNLVPALPDIRTLRIRPVATFSVHVLAMIGPHAVYLAMIVLVICSIALATRFVTRWMHVTSSVAAEGSVAFFAALTVGLSESAPFVVRYTGSFTHLLSGVLSFVAILGGLSYLDGKTAAKWVVIAVFPIALLTKEDVPAPVIMAFFLYGLAAYLETRDRTVGRRTLLLIITVLAMSIAGIAYNLAQQSSFVRTTLRGANGYGLTSASEVLLHFAYYLGKGVLLRFLVSCFFLTIILLFLRSVKSSALRLGAIFLIVLSQILPYAILSTSHLFDYYNVIWLPLLAASTATGLLMLFHSLKLPIWSQCAAAVFLIVVAYRFSTPQRNSIAAWLTLHQRKNANVIYALTEYRASLSRQSTVYVAGVDGGFSPFFFGDGGYVNYLVGNRDLEWVIIARPDSFMWDSYMKAQFPLKNGHVALTDTVDRSAARPLLDFDPTYRATLVQ